MDTGIKPAPLEAGFSLLEMLVVVTVLAILTVSVGLSMSFGRSKQQASDAANQLQTTLAQLRNTAIYSGVAQGLVISQQGWRVARFVPESRGWDMSAREIRWQVGVAFQPTSPDFSFGVPPVPEVVFLPDGQSSPFEITFSALGRYQTCRSDGWSGLTCGS